MKWKDAVMMILAMAAAPVAIWGLLAAAPVVGFVLLPGYFLWEVLGKGPRKRARERNQREQSRHRVDQLIQLHLVAHGLPDTTLNRARVLDQLARSPKR